MLSGERLGGRSAAKGRSGLYQLRLRIASGKSSRPRATSIASWDSASTGRRRACSSTSSARRRTITLLERAKLPVPRVLVIEAAERTPPLRRAVRRRRALFRRLRSRRRDHDEPPVYILGGHQTDFARNWTKEGKHIAAMIREAVNGGSRPRRSSRSDDQVGHVGNFAAELYAMQGHLGAFFVDVDPGVRGAADRRHEAACASGSIAILAASAEIEAGRYDCALVVGVEQMKTVDPGDRRRLPRHRRVVRAEAKGVEFPFPKLFGKLGDEYDRRYGLKDEHLARISAVNYGNAKRNPHAQTRNWYMSEDHASATGELQHGDRRAHQGLATARRSPTARSSVFLASEKFAREYAKRRRLEARRDPADPGLGPPHRAARFDDKVAESRDDRTSCRTRARRSSTPTGAPACGDCWTLDGIETHDCFTTSEYMAIDHFGLTAPGESWKAVEEGVIDIRRQAADQSERRPDRCRPSGRRDRRAPAARRVDAGDRTGRRLPGGERPAVCDAQYRRQRHHELRIHRRLLKP